MDREAWRATVHGVAKSRTRPSNWAYSPNALLLLQSCPTLCEPIDGSPPGSSVHRILQARTLEWVAISFSHSVATLVHFIIKAGFKNWLKRLSDMKSYPQYIYLNDNHNKNQHHTGSIRQCQSCGFSSSHVRMWAVAAAKSLQSCPTLCDRIDGSPPGSSVHGVL